MMRTKWTPVLAAPVIAMAFALSACGQPAPAGGGSAGSPSPSGSAATGALAFSQCMRQNGLPDYPDPDPATGAVDQSAINKDDPAYKKALNACKSKLPEGRGSGGEPPTAGELAQWKQFAQCMRDNGLPDFPDPDPNGGFGQNSGVDRTNPTFQKALKKCQDKAPTGGS